MADKWMKKQAFAVGRKKGYGNGFSAGGMVRMDAKSYAVEGTSAIKQEEEFLDWESDYESDYEVLKALWSVSAGQSFFEKIKSTIKKIYRNFMVEFFALDILEQL